MQAVTNAPAKDSAEPYCSGTKSRKGQFTSKTSSCIGWGPPNNMLQLILLCFVPISTCSVRASQPYRASQGGRHVGVEFRYKVRHVEFIYPAILTASLSSASLSFLQYTCITSLLHLCLTRHYGFSAFFACTSTCASYSSCGHSKQFGFSSTEFAQQSTFIDGNNSPLGSTTKR